MFIGIILLTSVVALLLLNLKMGIYRSKIRLINFDGTDENQKWKLITRWGP